LATRAGISPEYLTRIEQGRDRSPSGAVVHGIADALGLDLSERQHLRSLAKVSAGGCPGRGTVGPPERNVRPTVLGVLAQLEPGVAAVVNPIGDILAHTAGFAVLMRWTGLLDHAVPNLTRYVFTDDRARRTFPEWDQVADEQAFRLQQASPETVEWFTNRWGPAGGAEFTRRLGRPLPPHVAPLAVRSPGGQVIRWDRETLELPQTDAQQLLVFLPADDASAAAFAQLPDSGGAALRVV
jgi:hypothetical protein